MNQTNDRETLLLAVLRHVPFDGWSDVAYRAALADSGVSSERASIFFPNGVADSAAYFGRWIAGRLEDELDGLAEREPSIRRRIATGVRTLLLTLSPYREAVRRLSPLDSRRGTVQGMGALYQAVDAIWRAAGDRATDFSFYTKRGLLVAVVTATYFYWLDDESGGYEDTWAFLDRRIEDVMRIQRARGRAERFVVALGAPLDTWRKSPLREMSRRPSAR